MFILYYDWEATNIAWDFLFPYKVSFVLIFSSQLIYQSSSNEKRKLTKLTLFCLLFQVSRNIDLVYGGGSIGLMGIVSQVVHDGGRHVIG